MATSNNTAQNSKPITFVVPGIRQDGQVGQASRGAAGASTAPSDLPGRIKESVRVASRRGSGDTVRVSAVPGEDVVVLRIAGGPTLMLHPETARDLMLGQGETAPMQ